MKRFWMIPVSVLIFTIGCSVSGPAIRAEEEKIGEATKEVAETAVVKKVAAPAKEEATEIPKKETTIEKKATTMAAAEAELMEEISGLIIEQTMTKIGYEFYENFFIRWEAPKETKGYNIFINERASPFWGSWIQIKVDTTMVWSKVLKPRSEEIEEAAKQAVEVTKGFLSRYEEYKRELEGPDMVGSGI